MMTRHLLKTLFALLWVISTAGCNGDTVLNSQLEENEANEIIATLNKNNISTRKLSEKNGIAIAINKSDIEDAVLILNAAGLPRKEKTNLGAVFHKSGMISSPMEERARYIYALSQEVESTLLQIDGVVTARVHVVLPERIAAGEPVQPASVSVFIKYQPSLDPDNVEYRIRNLVSKSIPGITEKNSDNIAITFFPAQHYERKLSFLEVGVFKFTYNQLNIFAWFALCSLLLFIACYLLGINLNKITALLKFNRSRADKSLGQDHDANRQ